MEKNKRLRDNKDFQKIYKKGRRIWDDKFTVYFLKNGLKDESKVGFTVNKKIGNAVIRNHLKRRLKEIIRHHFPLIPKGYNIIIVPKKKVLGFSYSKLEKSLLYILSISEKGKR